MARQERERRYISEYMKKTFPEGNFQLNVELGEIPPEYVKRLGFKKAAALVRPTRPRVDAVHWSPDRYLLIEAKIRDMKAGIGDLLYYRGLIPETIDLPEYVGQPIVARMVVPWTLPQLQTAARANNIEIVIDEQDWIDEYIEEKKLYFTKEYRDARAEKMRLRGVLGVD